MYKSDADTNTHCLHTGLWLQHWTVQIWMLQNKHCNKIIQWQQCQLSVRFEFIMPWCWFILFMYLIHINMPCFCLFFVGWLLFFVCLFVLFCFSEMTIIHTDIYDIYIYIYIYSLMSLVFFILIQFFRSNNQYCSLKLPLFRAFVRYNLSDQVLLMFS